MSLRRRICILKRMHRLYERTILEMRKQCLAVVIVLLFMFLMVSDAYASALPAPAAFNTDVQAPSFMMTAVGGQVLTSENYGAGKNMLLVYGRVTCYNTQWFLYNLGDWLDTLSASGVTVLVGLHDDPEDEEVTDFSEFFGGVSCAKVSNDYYESGMWTGLDAVGAGTNMVYFPVVFLRTADGRLRYYSTGYVEDPLTVISAAIVMAGGNPMISSAEVVLPDDLTIIEAEAFRKDTFTSVYCGESVSSIGAYAFAENISLEWIYLPPSVKTIDKTAFSGCSESLVIYGKTGSPAEQFAKDNNITFIGR